MQKEVHSAFDGGDDAHLHPDLGGNPDAPQSVWFEKYELPTYAVQAARKMRSLLPMILQA